MSSDDKVTSMSSEECSFIRSKGAPLQNLEFVVPDRLLEMALMIDYSSKVHFIAPSGAGTSCQVFVEKSCAGVITFSVKQGNFKQIYGGLRCVIELEETAAAAKTSTDTTVTELSSADQQQLSTPMTEPSTIENHDNHPEIPSNDDTNTIDGPTSYPNSKIAAADGTKQKQDRTATASTDQSPVIPETEKEHIENDNEARNVPVRHSNDACQELSPDDPQTSQDEQSASKAQNKTYSGARNPIPGSLPLRRSKRVVKRKPISILTSSKKRCEQSDKLPIDPREDPVVCQICKKSYKDYCSLYSHVQLVHARNSENNYCDYLQELRLKKEVRCEICDKVYGDRNAYLSHKKLVHDTNEANVFKCVECGKEFTTEIYLKAHLDRVHTSRRILCHLCPANFKTKSSLNDHIECIHENNYRYECLKCSKKFKVRSTFIRHRKTHGSRDYVCPQCGKTFFMKLNLDRHVQIVHAKVTRVSCDQCGSTFSTAGNLRQHIRAIHDACDKVHCPICKRSFTRHTLLASHLKSHNTASPPVKKPPRHTMPVTEAQQETVMTYVIDPNTGNTNWDSSNMVLVINTDNVTVEEHIELDGDTLLLDSVLTADNDQSIIEHLC